MAGARGSSYASGSELLDEREQAEALWLGLGVTLGSVLLLTLLTMWSVDVHVRGRLETYTTEKAAN
jgi:hypothetical protein